MEGRANSSWGHGGASSIDNTTTLCSWGANSYGQLGQGHKDDQLLPVAIRKDLVPPEVSNGAVCIGGGGGFSFILTEDGRLMTCGNDDKGQLGRDKREKQSCDVEDVSNKATVFSICSALSGLKVVKAAAGWDFMVALVDSGGVYTWGSNYFRQLGRHPDGDVKIKKSAIPEQVQFPNSVPQQDIAAGMRHALTVNVEGHVFAWGNGRLGQLGSEYKNQEGKAEADLPQKVAIPGSVKIESVFAGMYHSGAVVSDGSVYIWGSNSFGQCCDNPKDNKCVFIPKKQYICPVESKERVVDVHSGWTHLVARTDKGNLYTWGRGNMGQLGRPCSDDGFEFLPKLMSGVNGVSSYACGSEHTIALADSKVYAWGWNEHGICATGDEENVLSPQRISSIDKMDLSVKLVGCGAGHTFYIGHHPDR